VLLHQDQQRFRLTQIIIQIALASAPCISARASRICWCSSRITRVGPMACCRWLLEGGKQHFFFLLEMLFHRRLKLLELPLAAGGHPPGPLLRSTAKFHRNNGVRRQKFSDSHDVFPHSMQKIQKISNYFAEARPRFLDLHQGKTVPFSREWRCFRPFAVSERAVCIIAGSRGAHERNFSQNQWRETSSTGALSFLRSCFSR
jgi:hypothetical protein